MKMRWTLLLLIFIATGCWEGEKMFDDKYVYGKVLSDELSQYTPVLIYKKRHHEESYIAFYESESYDYRKGDSIFGKVKSIKGFPLIYDIEQNENEIDLYQGLPITSINAHCFENHGATRDFHIAGHIKNGSLTQNSQNGTFTFIFLENNSQEETPYTARNSEYEIANYLAGLENPKKTYILTQSETNSLIIDIDTVHIHNGVNFSNE